MTSFDDFFSSGVSYDPDEFLAKLKRAAAINTPSNTVSDPDMVVGHNRDEATGKWTRYEVHAREVLWLRTGYSSEDSCPHTFGWLDRTNPDAPAVRELRCNWSAVARLIGVVPLRNLEQVVCARGARTSDGTPADYLMITEEGSTVIYVAKQPPGSAIGTPLTILEVINQFVREGSRATRIDANVLQAEEDRRALEELKRAMAAKAAAKIVSLDTARLARQAVGAVDAVTSAPGASTATDGDGFF